MNDETKAKFKHTASQIMRIIDFIILVNDDDDISDDERALLSSAADKLNEGTTKILEACKQIKNAY